MAKAMAHKFGQVIGDLLEESIKPALKQFTDTHGLYLDSQGPRKVRSGMKVTWKDAYGNKHDLDFVIERDGTENKIGIPVAFIETAWRRYTKHSKNKAQEIQGAIQPLLLANEDSAPFIGVVLAGDFSEGSLTQLRSLGFKVIYFTYADVIKSFASIGVDADYEEDTPDKDMMPRISALIHLSDEEKAQFAQSLMARKTDETHAFMDALDKAAKRTVELVRILPLYGQYYNMSSVEEAISFIQKYKEDSAKCLIIKYEVEIQYNNGDNIRGKFSEKDTAIAFLRRHQLLTPADVI